MILVFTTASIVAHSDPRGRGPEKSCIDLEDEGKSYCESGERLYRFINECNFDVFITFEYDKSGDTGWLIFANDDAAQCHSKRGKWCAATIGGSGC